MEVTMWGVIIAAAFTAAAIFIFRLLESLLRSRLVTRITDKYVLVTGCDSGFGNLVTRQLDSRGVRVFAACLTSKGQKELEEKTSERVITLRLDVTDHESVEAALRFVKEKLPKGKGLWGLVNNAGIAHTPGLIGWCSKEDYERTLGVNLTGVIDVTIAFLPLLRKARGRVVNIASALSRVALGAGGYTESKYGIQAFSDTLRRESRMLDYGIKVSILEPGFFRTNLTDGDRYKAEMKATWERLPAEKKAEYDSNLYEEIGHATVNFMSFVTSPNLTLVTNAMIHALLSRWPRTRYSCGLDMKIIFLPLSYAPTWLTDFIFLRAGKDNQPRQPPVHQ
ncbi:retinol dehydrogenase 7-like [Diadema antillarum]|uniref:retinol dehydrogenase 7-like n=1 Tax=Diadema antillarum TaxID=105358 RepID=UPI003A890CCD